MWNRIFRRRNALSELAQQAPSRHVFRDPKDEFAEIYGSALVHGRRHFLMALAMGLIALMATLALWQVSTTQVAVPWLVEVNASGVVRRPVRLERLTPPEAVLKAELATWVEQVFTIDPRQTPELLRKANERTRSKAVEQFRHFRVSEDVIAKIGKEPDLLRVPEVTSVDLSQAGLAFVFLTARSARGNEAPAHPRYYRVTLHYELSPPGTEAEILRNPLGVYVTFFHPVEERHP